MGDLEAVTATVVTRCRSRARSQKHASASRRFCTRPKRASNSEDLSHTLGQGPVVTDGRVRWSRFLNRDPLEALTGQPYSYAGDNPVNATDPSGLYEYTKQEEVGPVSQIGSAEQVMAVFQQNIYKVFPFPISSGCVIVAGAMCTLHPEPGWMGGSGRVVVDDVTDLTIAFTVVGKGYFDPVGSQITFSTYNAIGSNGQCDTFLQQYGNAPDANPLSNLIAPRLAGVSWNQQAQNLFNVAFLAMHPSADPWQYGNGGPAGSTPPANFPT